MLKSSNFNLHDFFRLREPSCELAKISNTAKFQSNCSKTSFGDGGHFKNRDKFAQGLLGASPFCETKCLLFKTNLLFCTFALVTEKVSVFVTLVSFVLVVIRRYSW